MKAGILYLILGLFMASCGPDAGHPEQNALSGSGGATPQPVTGIDSIRFATGACEGNCPVYTLVLFADNTARFEGGAFSTKTGIYTARLQGSAFLDIATFIDRHRMDTLKEEYNDGAMDVQNAMLYIYYKNGKTRQIVDMQMSGTPALTELYGRMEKIAETTSWIKQQ